MFHVPESARNTTHPHLWTSSADGNNGAFDLASPEPGWRLALICSDGTDPDVPEATGWEHVSVHAYRKRTRAFLLGSPPLEASAQVQLRTPTWKEMAFVKQLCWDDDDVVVQYHPRKSAYVNVHPHVLHLWRHRAQVFPEPPQELV
jgi:hypothetical protein